ncbi:rifin [Plasmodium falciparum RAJ116]|uniref:Rifin n=1 Tax=Plasmodium falciparum RAJ116 TaxID=580058 RepID=A0A0L0CYJ3_PLAFA|nr:rifin [Plasmodium falciparum RAJ116]
MILIVLYKKANMVINTHKKLSITPRHIQTTRLLCECELYMSNYDKDPEMKRVMQQFHDRTTQRFQEYDEKLQEKRQKCKEQCDKEIQKIILKDKIEKDLNEKFSLLHTDIQSDDIPTCICERSMTDKVEKGCLRCGYGLGSVAPMIGLTGSVAVNVWKTAELAAAKAAAIAEGLAAGEAARIKAGIDAVISKLSSLLGVSTIDDKVLGLVFDGTNYMKVSVISEKVYSHYTTLCTPRIVNGGPVGDFIFTGPVCNLVKPNRPVIWDSISAKAIIYEKVEEAVAKGTQAADLVAKNTADEVTKAAIETSKKAIEAATTSYYTPIIASIVAIVVIVLIMVIIYLILRYRRKRK